MSEGLTRSNCYSPASALLGHTEPRGTGAGRGAVAITAFWVENKLPPTSPLPLRLSSNFNFQGQQYMPLL